MSGKRKNHFLAFFPSYSFIPFTCLLCHQCIIVSLLPLSLQDRGCLSRGLITLLVSDCLNNKRTKWTQRTRKKAKEGRKDRASSIASSSSLVQIILPFIPKENWINQGMALLCLLILLLLLPLTCQSNVIILISLEFSLQGLLQELTDWPACHVRRETASHFVADSFIVYLNSTNNLLLCLCLWLRDLRGREVITLAVMCSPWSWLTSDIEKACVVLC